MNVALDTVSESVTTGDVLYAQTVAGTITAKKNGVTIVGLTATDTTYTSGRPGMFSYTENANGVTMDDWIGASIP